MGMLDDFLTGSFVSWLDKASDYELEVGYAKRKVNLRNRGGKEETDEMKMISAELLRRKNEKKGLETTAKDLSQIYGEEIDLTVRIGMSAYDDLLAYCKATGKNRSEVVEEAITAFIKSEAGEQAPTDTPEAAPAGTPEAED